MQSDYFGLALKAEIQSRPRGFKSALARETGIQAQQISNIISGVAYGSEERRRKLAQTLGWDYEQFLEYGRAISENRPYKRPVQPMPMPDANLFYLVPFHKKIKRAGNPGGCIFVPDETEKNQPIMLNKRYLDKQIDESTLAAFQMPDSSMEPTIEKGRIIIVDLTQRAVNFGSLYLLANEQNRFMVKRIQTKDEDIYLLSDNPKVSAELLRSAWNEVVVGRVIWTWIQQHE